MSLEETAEVQVVEIEYSSWDELSDVDPGTNIQTVLEDLNSKSWVEVCTALNNLRRLGKFHRGVIPSHLSPITASIGKALKNPRSALLKTTLVAISDLFGALGDLMIPALEDLLLPLLLKASQDKKFVADEAEKALSSMAMSLSPSSVLHRLQPHTAHKNPKVRAKAAVYVYQSASRLDGEGVKKVGMPFLLKLAGSQVSDQLPEAREAARKLSLKLFEAFGEIHSDSEDVKMRERWEELCRKQLAVTNCQAVLRITI